MSRFLTLTYYFSPRPDAAFLYTKVILAAVVLFFLAGLALSIYRKKYVADEVLKKMLRRYPKMLRNYGTILLFLLVARKTGIPYLAMRFWWVLWLGFLIYSLFKFLFTFRKEYQSRMEHVERRAVQERYLPQKKRR